MRILLADRQDITRAGMIYVLQGMEGLEWKYTDDKAELMLALKENDDTVVVLDYTSFDINDADELLILQQRFTHTRWLLFSEDLSAELVRVLIASSMQFSILLKESPLSEIKEAIKFCVHGNRFICQRMMEVLLAPKHEVEEKVNLTKTGDGDTEGYRSRHDDQGNSRQAILKFPYREHPSQEYLPQAECEQCS